MWSQKRQLGQNNYLQNRQLSGGLPGRQGFGLSKSQYGSLGGGYGTYGGGYASPSSGYGSPASGYAPSGYSPSGSGYGSSNSGYGGGYGRSDSYSPSGIASRSGGYGGNYASYSGGYKDCPGIPLALLLITLLGVAVLGVIFFLKVQAAGRRKRSSEEGFHWEDLLPIISIGRITFGCSKCHLCAFSCTKCLRHA